MVVYLKMPNFIRECVLPNSTPEALFAWHESPRAFNRLTPPWEPVALKQAPKTLSHGDVAIIEIPLLGRLGKKLPIKAYWHAGHDGYLPPYQFTDVQLKGPFAAWHHSHEFRMPQTEDAPQEATLLRDVIHFSLPFYPVSHWVAGAFVEAKLSRMFRFRHRITAYDAQRLHHWRDQFLASAYTTKVVLITGASGMIGTALQAFLLGQGFKVRVLNRHAKGTAPFVHLGVEQWDLNTDDSIPPQVFDGVEAVITLNGASISKRWTPEHKHALVESRMGWNHQLIQACLASPHRPTHWIGASGIACYPLHDTWPEGHEGYTESQATCPSDAMFHKRLVFDWEATYAPVQHAGIRLTQLRLGIVMDEAGGYMAQLQQWMQLVGGASLGKAKNPLPWVSLEDVLGVIQHVLLNPNTEGVYNVVAPAKTTQESFNRSWCHAMKMPYWGSLLLAIMVPLFGRELLNGLFKQGAPVKPQRLLEEGFTFLHPNTETLFAHTVDVQGAYEWCVSKL
jgi:uncharacterized protein